MRADVIASVPAPLPAPRPGWTGADKAGWFSHLLWPQLIASSYFGGLTELVHIDRLAGDVVVAHHRSASRPKFESALADGYQHDGVVLPRDDGLTIFKPFDRDTIPWGFRATLDGSLAGIPLGPYRLQSFDENRSARFVRAQTCRSHTGWHLPDVIEIIVVSDPLEAQRRFHRGEIDVCFEVARINEDVAFPRTARQYASPAAFSSTEAVRFFGEMTTEMERAVDLFREAVSPVRYTRAVYSEAAWCMPFEGSPERDEAPIERDVQPPLRDGASLRLGYNIENPARSLAAAWLQCVCARYGLTLNLAPMPWSDLKDFVSEQQGALLLTWADGDWIHERTSIPLVRHVDLPSIAHDPRIASIILGRPPYWRTKDQHLNGSH